MRYLIILVAVLSLAITVTAQTSPNPDLARCPEINPLYLNQLSTANRWYDAIKTIYGPSMAQHYKWLECGAGKVDDWFKNSKGVRPETYFGLLGYDSPIGTCTSKTPFKMNVYVKGTKGEDGKVRGWVRWHSNWYVGVVEDPECTDSCVAVFEHPCDLTDELEYPAQAHDTNGVLFYTWYWGGNTNGEPPW